MLEVKDLNAHYGKTQALFNVGFTVEPGEVLGFLGPNGAGKSTTMRILAGCLAPSSGKVIFNGKDSDRDRFALRRNLGYMPEHVSLYPELTVREYLHWAAQVKGAREPKKQAAEVMARCMVSEVSHRLIRHLSKGYRQRVALAQALVGDPRLLILDEPTIGMDPGQVREMRRLIKELGGQTTIVLSSHVLPEVELTCDRVLIINKGRIIAEGTPRTLAGRLGAPGRYHLVLDLPPEQGSQVARDLESADFVISAEVSYQGPGGCEFLIETAEGRDCRALVTARAAQNGWPVLEFRPAVFTLEDAFMSLVGKDAAEGGDA